MNLRQVVPQLFFILILLPGISGLAETTKSHNIIFILADDLGWADTTLYGKTTLYETPNIERLAKRGVTFTNAYTGHICSSTRASIMSGQNAARHGFTGPLGHIPEIRYKALPSAKARPELKCTNVRSSTRLDPAVPTLAEVLKEAGYATGHFGKWHLGKAPHSPLEAGFDVDIPHWHGSGPGRSYLAPWSIPNFKENAPGEHIEDRMAEEATKWIRERDRSKPFYMNYWQFSVHAPFQAKPELVDYYRKKIKRGEAQQSPTYAAMVHTLDNAIGSLLDVLDEEKIADETVIIFYSDNGGNIHSGITEKDASGEEYITALTSNHPLRGGKGGIHDGGIRVPGVVVWPGVTEAATRSDVRIHATDFYPTILSMLNIKFPGNHTVDGVDISKAVAGKDMDRGPMFTYVPVHGSSPHWLPPAMAVHYGDWKFIRIFHYGENGEHDYRLYNIRQDIGESNDIAQSYPEKVKEMDQLIESYITQVSTVLPVVNPNFNPAKFDASKIGIPPNGLKMFKLNLPKKKTPKKK